MPAWVGTHCGSFDSTSCEPRFPSHSEIVAFLRSELPGGHSTHCMGPPRWIFDEEVLVSTWSLYALFMMHRGNFSYILRAFRSWSTTYLVPYYAFMKWRGISQSLLDGRDFISYSSVPRHYVQLCSAQPFIVSVPGVTRPKREADHLHL
jgi:hypothetical protein